MFEQEIARQAAERPLAPAISTSVGDVSYGKLDQDANRIAHALRGIGLSRGIVAVRIENPVLHWVFLLALIRLRIPSCSIGNRAEAELAELRSHRPDILITDKEIAGFAGSSFVASPGWIASALQGPTDPIDAGAPEPSDPLRVATSSGTTGVPKRMMFTRALIEVRGSEAELYLDLRGGSNWLRTLLAFGVETVGGFMGPLYAWARGSTLIYPPSGFAWGSLLRDQAVTDLVLAPIQLERIVQSLPADFEPLPGLAVIAGGSALSEPLAELTRRRLTPHLLTGYGSSEAGSNAMIRSEDRAGRPGAVGKVLQGCTVEIVDEDDTPLAPGASGHIRVRSRTMIESYMDPEPGLSALRGGWFYPGDLGRIDPDGVLVIEGRVNDLMNLGGDKVAPSEIEERLLGCPGVREAAVFAIPSAMGVAQPYVALVTGAGYDAAAVNLVLRGAASSAFTVLQVDSLPRNRMGKLQRSGLAALVAPGARGG